MLTHAHIERKKETKVISVDIPSGWDVELGDVASPGIRPHMLVSI